MVTAEQVGRASWASSKTPTYPVSTSLYTMKQNKGAKVIGRQTEHAFKKRAAYAHTSSSYLSSGQLKTQAQRRWQQHGNPTATSLL